MKRLPILALGGAMALCVFSGAALAETIEANDTPDIVLPVGPDGSTMGADAFDLGDFFSSDENASVDVSVEGSVSVTDGVVSIPSQDTVGEGVATFTAGAEVATTNIYYSDFMIEDRPNAGNLFAGMSASNFLLQGIVPGSSVSGSIGALPTTGGSPSGSDGGSPSGGATLIAKIGEMSLSEGVTGLRTRVIGEVGDSVGGLSVTLGQDGAYTISADASFDGAAVVSLGAESGDGTDVVQMIAAPAMDLDLSTGWNGGSIESISFTANTAETFIVGPAVDAPGDTVTLVMTYTSTTTDVALALIGFDGTDFSDLYFTNPKNGGLAAGETHTLILSMSSLADQVQCCLQVTPKGTDGTINIESYQVLNSPALTSLAVNPNATLAGMPDGSMAAGLEGWTTPVNAGEVAGTVSTDNNFATATSAGSASLNGSANPSNILKILDSVSAGVVSVEAYIKKVSGDAGSFLILVDDGAANNSLAALRGAAKIPTDSWQKIEASTAIADSGFSFVVAQAAGGLTALVDDFSVRVWADGETFFDSRLAGL